MTDETFYPSLLPSMRPPPLSLLPSPLPSPYHSRKAKSRPLPAVRAPQYVGLPVGVAPGERAAEVVERLSCVHPVTRPPSVRGGEQLTTCSYRSASCSIDLLTGLLTRACCSQRLTRTLSPLEHSLTRTLPVYMKLDFHFTRTLPVVEHSYRPIYTTIHDIGT